MATKKRKKKIVKKITPPSEPEWRNNCDVCGQPKHMRSKCQNACGNYYCDGCQGAKDGTCVLCSGKFVPKKDPNKMRKLPTVTLATQHGWLLPNGKLYPCDYWSHQYLLDDIQKAYGLHRMQTHEFERKYNLIKLQFGSFWIFFRMRVTQAQFDTIAEYTGQGARSVCDDKRLPDVVTLADLEIMDPIAIP